MVNGNSTVVEVEYSPHHDKVKCLSASVTNGMVCCDKIAKEASSKSISSTSIVGKHSSHYHKVKGLIIAATAGKREKSND